MWILLSEIPLTISEIPLIVSGNLLTNYLIDTRMHWKSTYHKKTLPARLDQPLWLQKSQHMFLKPTYVVEMTLATDLNG